MVKHLFDHNRSLWTVCCIQKAYLCVHSEGFQCSSFLSGSVHLLWSLQQTKGQLAEPLQYSKVRPRLACVCTSLTILQRSSQPHAHQSGTIPILSGPYKNSAAGPLMVFAPCILFTLGGEWRKHVLWGCSTLKDVMSALRPHIQGGVR